MLVLGRAHKADFKISLLFQQSTQRSRGFFYSPTYYYTRLLEIPMRILYYEHVQFVAPPVQWGPAGCRCRLFFHTPVTNANIRFGPNHEEG